MGDFYPSLAQTGVYSNETWARHTPVMFQIEFETKTELHDFTKKTDGSATSLSMIPRSTAWEGESLLLVISRGHSGHVNLYYEPEWFSNHTIPCAMMTNKYHLLELYDERS